MADESCTYTHDLGSGTWDCPHPAEGDGDLCVFHAPVSEKADGAAVAAFREQVDRPGKRCKEFVGARFGGLDLAFARIDAPDNYPVSLVDAHVEGEMRLTSGAVEQPLVVDGLSVEGSINCENAVFGAECAADGVRFDADVDFQGSTFRERVRIQNADFRGPTNFHSVRFEDTVDFERSDFGGPVDFARTDFLGDAVFAGVRFADSADFEAIGVEGKTDFRGARFARRVSFRDGAFESSAAFGVPSDAHRSTVELEHHRGGRPTESVFEFEGVLEHVDRRHSEPSEQRVVDDGAPHFGAEADFVDTEFVEEVGFERVRFGAPPDLRETTFRDPVAFHAPTVEGGVIDLRESEVPGGTLGQIEDGEVVYDLRGATLGDVTVEAGRSPPFEHCRLLYTTFEGFDFGRYREALTATNWQIHTDCLGMSEDLSVSDLETTYLKAKNGASAVGDDDAAAEFFRRELAYRRKAHARRAREGDGLRSRLVGAGQWVANGLLDLSSGYGERPSRVVVFSLLVIALFAPVFWLLRPEPPYDAFPAFGYVVLSFESFATVIHGGGPSLSDPLVRFLAEVEAFTGGFLIGLFVFALTRSINR